MQFAGRSWVKLSDATCVHWERQVVLVHKDKLIVVCNRSMSFEIEIGCRSVPLKVKIYTQIKNV